MKNIVLLMFCIMSICTQAGFRVDPALVFHLWEKSDLFCQHKYRGDAFALKYHQVLEDEEGACLMLYYSVQGDWYRIPSNGSWSGMFTDNPDEIIAFKVEEKDKRKVNELLVKKQEKPTCLEQLRDEWKISKFLDYATLQDDGLVKITAPPGVETIAIYVHACKIFLDNGQKSSTIKTGWHEVQNEDKDFHRKYSQAALYGKIDKIRFKKINTDAQK